MTREEYLEMSLKIHQEENISLKDKNKKLRKINKEQKEYINKIKSVMSFLPFSVDEFINNH
jgi:hypothetical protein